MKTEHASVCPLDCPDTCSLTVTVENARIVRDPRLAGEPLHRGGASAPRWPARIPDWVHGARAGCTRRCGGRAPRARAASSASSWDEALDIIHERVTAVIAAHGPQAVLPLNYAGPHGMLADALHGPALLPQARRLACSSAAALRRHPHPGVDRHVRDRARHRARAGAALQADRRVGQQRDLVEPPLTPLHQRGAAGRRPSWWWSIPSAPRSPSRRICTSRSSPAPTWCSRGRWPPSSSGAEPSTARSSRATWRASRTSWRSARRYAVAEAARDLRACPRPQIRHARRVVPHALPGRRSAWATGSSATRTAAAASARSSRCPRWPGKFGVPGGGLVNGAGFAFPKTPAKLAAAGLRARRARARSTSWTSGRHLLDPTLVSADQGALHLQPQPARGAPDQNRMRRGLAREDLFVVGSEW